MAMESQGMYVCFSTSSATTTAVAAAVEQVNSVSGPSGSANVIDVTHLQSTAKEKLIGLRDEGQVTLDINFLASATNQQKLIDMRARRIQSGLALLFNDVNRSAAKMMCYVSGFSVNAAVDAKLTASVTIEIDGPVTWTTWAT